MEYSWTLVENGAVAVEVDAVADREAQPASPAQRDPRRLHGRSDFVGGIDNEALDFSQLEDFINDDTDDNHTYFGDTLTSNEGVPVRSLTSVVVSVDNGTHHQLGSKAPVVSAVLGTAPAFSQPDTAYTLPHSLPDSPPDSGSEPPYSPQAHSPHQKTTSSGGLTDLLMQSPVYGKPPHTIHIQGADTILVQHPSVLTPLLTPQQQTPASTVPGGLALAPHAGLAVSEDQPDPSITAIYSSLGHASKKRKLSEDNVRVKQESATLELTPDEELSFQEGSTGEGSLYLDSSSFQCIRFQPFQQSNWLTLCDQNLKELHVPHYRVDADKGFNFSNADDAFVCQKKNHFQITCHAQLQGDAQFVKTPDGLRKIASFHLHFYGVKVESPSQTIKVEQSQSDRSKKAFHPVLVDLHGEQVTKVTVGRLHFSETTSNNMRKKGKPNPDQRYFYLVVGLHAHCSDNSHYPIVSHASERIIVRASNPGQFESDVEVCWQRGAAADSIYHAGRVGVNTDRPDEALVVHGNMKVTGHIVQPSDLRAKRDIQECDSAQQLINVRQLRVVKYRYDPEFSDHCGLDHSGSDTGIIAQELRNILPEAVMPAGDIVLPSGTRIDNFLVVNKERILMESVGAVKELCKVTDNLESRIGELERINKLVKLKRFDSLKSNTSAFSVGAKGKLKGYSGKACLKQDDIICSNQLIQVTIVVLILIMAMCLMAMFTLYILEYQKRSTYGLSELTQNRLSNENLAQTRFRSTTMTSYWTLDVRPNVSDYTNSKWTNGKKHSGGKKGTHGSGVGGVALSTNAPPSLGARECGVADFAISCQTFCCSSRPLQLDNSISYKDQHFQFQRSDATPATNAIEELSENGSLDTTNKQQREWLPNKDALLVPHKKRQAEDFIQPENSFSSADFSTGLDMSQVKIEVTGSALNTTVEHCSEPYPTQHNVTCVLHLSQYLADPNVTLHFKSVRGVQLCHETRMHQCQWPSPSPSPHHEAPNRFRVDVLNSLALRLTFRLPYAHTPNPVCNEPESQVGQSFMEYNLYLFRDCHG